MAHCRNNVITHSYSGRLGGIIMQHDGVFRSLPDTSKRSWSEKQVQHLSRFELAKDYGRQVVGDPLKTEHYAVFLKRWRRKLRNTGIYQLAIMDFMSLPEIEDVMLDRHSGGTRNVVRIYARDRFSISGVEVSLVGPGGVRLAGGEAAFNLLHGFYDYIITDLMLIQTGVICRVCARDIPGNITEKEFHLFG
jgi:hypothetical protein